MSGFSDLSTPSLDGPGLPIELSEADAALVEGLQSAQSRDVTVMLLCRAYLQGMQPVKNLDIAVPPDVASKLRALVGWARMAVDPYVERLSVDGFRLPGETDVNSELAEIWSANALGAEESMAFQDALTLGRAFWMVGSGVDDDMPRITVESPLTVAASWDLTGRKCTAAWQTYKEDGAERGSLMLPNRTVYVEKSEADSWVVVREDVHDFGFVPLVRMAHAPSSDDRSGRSAITPELQSVIDSACRTLLDLEVARELYSAPRWVLLGATESFFKHADGTQRQAWDTYLTKVLGLGRDEDGELPSITQLNAYDPGVFTKLIEMYASEAAGLVSAVPQEMGLHTTGNPTNAESLRAANGARDSRVRRMQRTFGPAIAEVMKFALMFRHGGVLPVGFERVETDWHDLSVETPTVTADALSKYVGSGLVPARSDVVLKRAGFSAVERLQLEQDWDAADAAEPEPVAPVALPGVLEDEPEEAAPELEGE